MRPSRQPPREQQWLPEGRVRQRAARTRMHPIRRSQLDLQRRLVRARAHQTRPNPRQRQEPRALVRARAHQTRPNPRQRQEPRALVRARAHRTRPSSQWRREPREPGPWIRKRPIPRWWRERRNRKHPSLRRWLRVLLPVRRRAGQTGLHPRGEPRESAWELRWAPARRVLHFRLP
jgi:hypothetical protein